MTDFIIKSITVLKRWPDAKCAIVEIVTDDGPYEQSYIDFSNFGERVVRKVKGIQTPADRLAVSFMTLDELEDWKRRF